jgi:hypothetical protein
MGRLFCPAPVWPEGNVTLDYLSTLNTWRRRFNFLLLAESSFTQCREAGSSRQYCFEI